MTAATANNPDLARWADGGRQTPSGLAVGEGPRRAGYHRRRRACDDTKQTDDAAMVFGLAVPLPLFDRNQGGILAATAELGKARRQYEAAQVRILAALSEAVSTLGGRV